MAFPYVRHSADWKDAASATGGGDTSTPITATALDTIEAGIDSLSNILELADASGDLLAASGADAWVRLAKGSDDSVLSVAAGALSYRKIVNAMIDAAAAIAVSKLAASSTAGDVLTTVGGVATWAAAAAGGIDAVTALPGSPADGDEVLFMDSLTAPTYQWHLRYLAAKASNKWLFVGGAPGFALVATNETISTTAYGALATAGPSFAIPVAGDYDVAHGFNGDPNTGANLGGKMSYDIGGTGAVNADAAGMWGNTAGTNYLISAARKKRKTGLTAVTLTAKYASIDANSVAFEQRWMSVTPVAIGG